MIRSWLMHLLHTALETPALRKLLQRHLNESHAHLSIDVHLISQAQSRKLNREYLQHDFATDVLSFPAPRWESIKGSKKAALLTQTLRAAWHEELSLGELLICEPVLKRQARAYRHSEADEWRVLLTHGFLHLLGMDHETSPQAAKKMAKWEIALLTSGGYSEERGMSLITRAQLPDSVPSSLASSSKKQARSRR